MTSHNHYQSYNCDERVANWL